MFKKIWEIAKQNANVCFYYRFDILLYIFNYIVEITVYIFIWLAIYRNGNQILGMSFEQITTYYVLMVSLSPIIKWGVNEYIGEAIREGEILKELLNPISYFSYYFGIRMGDTFQALFVGVITFILCSLFFGVLPPQGMMNFVFFLIVSTLAIVIVYFFEITLGMTAFYTNSIWGIEVLKRAILTVFSGMIAPITLFPEFLQKIANVLPFKDCIYTPINIYLGELTTGQVLQVILKQCVWILILYGMAKIIFKKSIKNITINGG